MAGRIINRTPAMQLSMMRHHLRRRHGRHHTLQFGTPAEFAAYVAADLAKWTRLAKEANLKIE
jgi:tripartite-type tricarboxylate transporter receptor subunit TctC